MTTRVTHPIPIAFLCTKCGEPLQWRHNERVGVSDYQRLDCLLNRLFMRKSKKHQSSASLAFVSGIHRWPVNSPHKGPVTRKMLPLVMDPSEWASYWGWGVGGHRVRNVMWFRVLFQLKKSITASTRSSPAKQSTSTSLPGPLVRDPRTS